MTAGVVAPLAAALAALGSGLAAPLVELAGADFAGGGQGLFGPFQFGRAHVNYVYALPTGAPSRMEASFCLDGVPHAQLSLHILARDDDGPGKCSIAVRLNDAVLFEGPNPFPEDRWSIESYPLPSGALRVGQNMIGIENRESSGRVGMPPWFMVAACFVAPPGYDPRRDVTREFTVRLPGDARPLPEPRARGVPPGFRWRGIKGWLWRPEQYLAEIPFLAARRMNFMMVCYGSLCDIESYGWGDPRCNRWWEPLPETKREAYADVVRACHARGIAFCFSMNPALFSARPLDYESPADTDALYQHYAWMQGLGVRWFSIAMDDITEGIDPHGQAALVNEVLQRLRASDPDAQMIFCPTYYWGDGTEVAAADYLAVLARELHPDTYVFWTGDSVVGPITRRAAESYRNAVGHRLFIWDNYPVNDAHPTMHLGPVVMRDPDLCAVADGYMSNSMCPQNEANRIPLSTCADYAYNPWAYDPARSIGQAIIHLAQTDEQRAALRDLVEAYPGNLLYRQGTAYNPVRARLEAIAEIPHSAFMADLYLSHLEGLAARMNRAFPTRFRDALATLEADMRWVRSALEARHGWRPRDRA